MVLPDTTRWLMLWSCIIVVIIIIRFLPYMVGGLHIRFQDVAFLPSELPFLTLWIGILSIDSFCLQRFLSFVSHLLDQSYHDLLFVINAHLPGFIVEFPMC